MPCYTLPVNNVTPALTPTSSMLNNNRLTGQVPLEIWKLVDGVVYSTYGYYDDHIGQLETLNVGDNLLTGPVERRFLEYFTELWLQGNPWDGPCAALCGVNVGDGDLDSVKRATLKTWTEKCRVSVEESTWSGSGQFESDGESIGSGWGYDADWRTNWKDPEQFGIEGDDSYAGDAQTESYFIDASQRCILKADTCSSGQLYVARRTVIDPDCKRCPANTFQRQTQHTETSCNPHPTCGIGERISVDDDDSRTENRTCFGCATHMYQSATDHRLTECIDQPTCGAGQKITGTDGTVDQRRICVPCPPGFYQNISNHRETDCKPQPPCTAGTAFEVTSTEERECTPCGDNEYQDSSDENALQTSCIEQPTCGAGQKMANDTKTKRRQCSDCPAGQYQDDSEHRSTTCTEHPKCEPGTLFRGSLYAERTCDACPPNTYQPAINHTETTCIPQQGCLPQQAYVGDSTTKGRCEPCKDGSVQPENNHFDACIDISLPTTVCNGVGELNSGGTCECNDGFAGPQCEFSNEETCNGFGRVSYNAQANAASCSNCTDPAIAVGDWCQFSNSKTCKDFGIVSGDGTCDWNRNLQGEPIVSECDAGYYYNPNPETPGNEAEDEDAIDVGVDNCYPCSPGHFATGTARRVQCDACPTVSVETDDGALRDMLQTSEPASTSASDCFAKFQSAAADQQFCYGENVDAKPLSRIKSSDDCSISATSLGLTFAGEFVLPYPGCMYDEEHQEARFYVGQSQYDQALSMASSNSDNNSGNNDDNNDDDGSNRRRRKERQQHQQRRRIPQQPREQDQQPQRRSHQKRRRKLKLVPMKDTPLCELYVCKDPKNEVTALTSDPADAGATPSCKVSVAQIKEAYAAEQAESQSTFMPAAFSLSAAALVGSYVHQYRSASKAGLAFTISNHLGAWLTSLRVFDMLTDFGFYFISLHGSEAFLEAYSDEPVLNECGQPETNPYEEPKVAAFLYISVFCTALGLFMTPLDIWAMSQRSVGGGMGIVGVAVVLSITLFEDTPQLALASIYINTMREVDIEPDPVSILSLAASALSMLFNVATVVYYARKLRVQDPTGWWKVAKEAAVDDDTSDQAKRNDALEAENAALKQEVAQLKSKKEMKKNKTKKHARSTVTTMANPVFNDDEYLDVQDTRVLQTEQAEQAETQFSDFDDDLDGSDFDV